MKNNIYCYTVYDRKSQLTVTWMEPAKKCAELMGISLDTFYEYVYLSKHGCAPRWDISKYDWMQRFYLANNLSPRDKNKPMKLSVFARTLGFSSRRIVKMCEQKGVPITRAGSGKTMMIFPQAFFEKLDGEDLNEII